MSKENDDHSNMHKSMTRIKTTLDLSVFSLSQWVIIIFEGFLCKHKEAFSTLVESLVQMTFRDFIIFFFGLLLWKTVESVPIYKKFVKSRCRLGYSAEICVLYSKLGQFQKIPEINAGHLYQGLDQSAKGFFMFGLQL